MAPWNDSLEFLFRSECRPSSEHKGGTDAKITARNSKCRNARYLLCSAVTLLRFRQVTAAGFILLVAHLILTVAASTPGGQVPPNCNTNASVRKKLLQAIAKSLTGVGESQDVRTKRHRYSNSLPRSAKTKSSRDLWSDELPRGYPKRYHVEWISSFASPDALSQILVCPDEEDDRESNTNDLARTFVASDDDDDSWSTSNELAASQMTVRPDADEDTQSKTNVKSCSFLRVASTLVRRASLRGSSFKKEKERKGGISANRALSLGRRQNSLQQGGPGERSAVDCSASQVEDKLHTLRVDSSSPPRKAVSTNRARGKIRRKTISLAESALSFMGKEKHDNSLNRSMERETFLGLLRKIPKPRTKDSYSESSHSTTGTSPSDSSGFGEPSAHDTETETGSTASSISSSVRDSPDTNWAAASPEDLQMQNSLQEPFHAMQDTSGQPHCCTVEKDKDPRLFRKYAKWEAASTEDLQMQKPLPESVHAKQDTSGQPRCSTVQKGKDSSVFRTYANGEAASADDLQMQRSLHESVLAKQDTSGQRCCSTVEKNKGSSVSRMYANGEAASADDLQMQRSLHESVHAKQGTSGQRCCSTVEKDKDASVLRTYAKGEAASADDLQVRRCLHESAHAKHATSGQRCRSTVEKDKDSGVLRKYACIRLETDTAIGELTLRIPQLHDGSRQTVWPVKLQFFSTTYKCFTLQTIETVLQDAEEHEAAAIADMLRRRKHILLDSLPLLDDVWTPSYSKAIWCIPVNESGTEESSHGTLLLVDCNDVECCIDAREPD